jgi:hypothetical protein
VVEKLTKEMFSENLNTKFLIYPDGEASEALETELVDFKEITTSPRQEQFSVQFRGPLKSFLNQGMYRVKHEKIGTFDLFLVPIREEQDGFYYEAAFNRLFDQK